MADLKVGDEVEHRDLRGVVWLVLRINVDQGISTVQNKVSGEVTKYFTAELIPTRRKPTGSLITW